MSATDLIFPVICFNQGIFEVVKDFDTLTMCNKQAVKRGWYNRMFVIDSTGKAIRVASARKLHGVGLFWGYNIFLNQKVKVELVYDSEPFQMSVEDVRERVLDSLNKWHGWQTRGDFDEWKTSIENARTVADIIRLVAS